MKLQGRRALVTGASRGIGRDVCLALAEAGADVACVATHADNVVETVQAVRGLGRRAVGIGARVEHAEAVDAMFTEAEATLGTVDILVNNAGINDPKPVVEMSEADYDRIVDVNAKSVFLCARRAAQALLAAGAPGSVINIGSIAGDNAFPMRLAYCSSKAAVHHMTRVMALEWAEAGIRVNCIAPGYIRTDLVNGLIQDGKLDESRLTGRIPQRRLGTPRDIGAAAVYLASEDAGYVTGTVLTVDGGYDAYGFL